MFKMSLMIVINIVFSIHMFSDYMSLFVSKLNVDEF